MGYLEHYEDIRELPMLAPEHADWHQAQRYKKRLTQELLACLIKRRQRSGFFLSEDTIKAYIRSCKTNLGRKINIEKKSLINVEPIPLVDLEHRKVLMQLDAEFGDKKSLILDLIDQAAPIPKYNKNHVYVNSRARK